MNASSNSDASKEFYDLLERVPKSEATWAGRQATLRAWRSDRRFEAYWAAIDQMLTVDFDSFRRRAAAGNATGDLEGYDYDAFQAQREYDLKHAHDHLL